MQSLHQHGPYNNGTEMFGTPDLSKARTNANISFLVALLIKFMNRLNSVFFSGRMLVQFSVFYQNFGWCRFGIGTYKNFLRLTSLVPTHPPKRRWVSQRLFRIPTVFLVEKDFELVLVLILQTLLKPSDGLFVGEVAVHEAAATRFLHHLPKETVVLHVLLTAGRK